MENTLKDKDKALSDNNDQLAQLKSQLAQAQQTVAVKVTAAAPQPVPASLLVPKEKSHNTSSVNAEDDQEIALTLKWVAIAMLVTLLLGFMWGKHWVDQKIRKRHGGIRIY